VNCWTLLVAPPRWRTKLRRFDAVIFDMDGVLVDGEPLHFEAVNRLLAEEGRSITLDQYKPYMGTKSGWKELISDFGLNGSYEMYSERYTPMLVDLYRERSEALPGAREAVESLKGVVPIAVCSSSILPWVEAALSKIGLLNAFDEIISGSEVREGKPAPDIYLLAASRVNVHPSRALAIEDAPAGIASATAAGMTVWAVRTAYTQGLELPSCDRVMESLLEFETDSVVGVAA
jgi:HAD superfamily hydrolase (TIGR01509 family)